MALIKKPKRLVKRVLYPGIPYRLASSAGARGWGARFGERWGNEYGALYRRYRTLSRRGGLPAITDYYVRRKIELGSGISALPAGKWKEGTKTKFGEIKGMRKDTLYTMAMLPFQVLKHEDSLERLLKEADGVSRLMRTSFADTEPHHKAAERYRHILGRVQNGKKKLEEYSDKLKLFRAALQEIEEDSPTVWGQKASPRAVLEDLDKIEKHVAEAQERFELASMDMERRSRTVEGSSSWAKRWSR